MLCRFILPCQVRDGGRGRNRTGVDGFAIRCITTLQLGLSIYPKNGLKAGFRVFPIEIGAGKGTRTLDPDLGKVVLYQLSYSRSGTKIL